MKSITLPDGRVKPVDEIRAIVITDRGVEVEFAIDGLSGHSYIVKPFNAPEEIKHAQQLIAALAKKFIKAA